MTITVHIGWMLAILIGNLAALACFVMAWRSWNGDYAELEAEAQFHASEAFRLRRQVEDRRARFNVGSDNLSDQDRASMRDDLDAWIAAGAPT